MNLVNTSKGILLLLATRRSILIFRSYAASTIIKLVYGQQNTEELLKLGLYCLLTYIFLSIMTLHLGIATFRL